ncbi:MAG TPA: hypothetical protein VN451_06870 [Chitinophagaceae bacterium]|nr:hypothetical protein [Chitinophagaceae bacterium]
MNINRHNYEEYFILYMDNELGSEDCRMVEAFVQQHPDLKEELDIFLQYKLSPDNSVIFSGKQELMRVNGDTPVTPANYEDWLTLYVDDELTLRQKESVEKFIATSPAAQKELSLLLKTKLLPEEIIFDNKESLYRRDEKVRPLPVRWWRLAAAAILVLAVGITAVLVFNNKSSNGKPDTAKTPGTDQKNSAQTNVAKQNEEPYNDMVPEEPVTNNKDAVADNKNNIKQYFSPVGKHDNKNQLVKNAGTKKLSVNEKLQVKLPLPIKKQDEVVADINNKPSNNLPQPLYNPNIIKTNVPDPVVAITDTPNEIANTITEPANNDVVTKIIPATYNSSEPLEDDGKNKKNRGIFRKLARTIEKRTNMNATDGDRLLVGGLSFKLK